MKSAWGKVVGGAMGFALGGGPLGAILGVLAGHAYDSREEIGLFAFEAGDWRSRLFGGDNQPLTQDPYTMGVITLGAKLAKADGRVTRAEIDAFKRAFKVTPKQEEQVGQLFDIARRSADGFEPQAFLLAQHFRTHPIMLEQILSSLFEVAAADGPVLTSIESRFLKRVAYIFNMGPEDFTRIAASAKVRLPGDDAPKEQVSEPFATLGLSEKASNDTIKSTYRDLIRKHHPDRLAGRGATPEQLAAADERMKRINAAYDTVSRQRGIK